MHKKIIKKITNTDAGSKKVSVLRETIAYNQKKEIKTWSRRSRESAENKEDEPGFWADESCKRRRNAREIVNRSFSVVSISTIMESYTRS